jgi:hypothetical protein
MGRLKCNVFSVEIALCLALIFLSVYAPIHGNKRAFAQTFSDPINLSNITHGAECQDIKVSGNNVYVAWSDHQIGSSDILFRKSSDGGVTFGITQDLSESSDSSSCPQIAVSGNNVYVVWNEGTLQGPFDVFFRRSTDSGENFDAIINLSHNSRDSCCPSIATSGKLVHVVWDDDTPPGSNDFFTLYSRSTNTGSSFSEPRSLIMPPIDEALDAKVGASGDYVFVVWNGDTPGGDPDVYMRISKDGGKNFGTTKNLSSDDADSGTVDLKVTGNNVYVVWVNTVGEDNHEIFFRKSTDKGSSFSKVRNLSNDPTQSFDPIVSAFGNQVYIVWEDEDDTGSDVLFKRSTDAGATFKTTKNLSLNPSPSFGPSIARDGSNVQVAWTDGYREESEILFRRSIDSGNHFDGRIDISNKLGTSLGSVIASAHGLVYITWIEQSNDGNNDNLFFVKSNADSLNANQKQINLILPVP